jgi:hypothetical protein
VGRSRYSVREEIKETADAFYRSLSSKNLKAIDTIWAHEPYAAVAGPHGALHQGWPEVRRFWERRFEDLAGTSVKARLSGLVYHAVGDVAWLSGRECRSLSAKGETWEEELRVTCVLERSGTHWQIVSYHASLPAVEDVALAPAS